VWYSPSNKKKSLCYDEITSKILKACSSLASHPLRHIFNNSLRTFTFPDSLKILVVKPLYQRDDKTTVTNCRPVALLTAFSKVFEKIMCNGLSYYIHIINILVLQQFGFRKGKSTVNAAFILTVCSAPLTKKCVLEKYYVILPKFWLCKLWNLVN
jgi:hypothetical protein